MRRFRYSLLFAVILAACSGGANNFQATDFDLPPEVEVTFQVLAPESTNPEAIISLTVLDPLTGEIINPVHHPMLKEGEFSYSVSLSAPLGSLIRYRYSLGSDQSISEIAHQHARFEHRLYLVDGPGHVVTDLIAGWQGDQIDFEAGTVHGQLFSSSDGEPLSGIEINISGLRSITDDTGEFVLSGLQQGLHNLVAIAPRGDFQAFQQGALVAAGAETPAVFEMVPAERVNINFEVSLPDDHVPGIPLFLLTDLAGSEASLPASYNEAGNAIFTVELAISQDIRYKYSLGDGFWNAEHLPSGQYLTRQLLLDESMQGLVIRDQIASWQAGASAPIWFEAQLENLDDARIFIQFKFTDWTPAIEMWPLGNGNFAYKLSSPTNFAAPLEYRYCQDAFCLHAEDHDETRSVRGNLASIQYSEDQISAWK